MLFVQGLIVGVLLGAAGVTLLLKNMNKTRLNKVVAMDFDKLNAKDAIKQIKGIYGKKD